MGLSYRLARIRASMTYIIAEPCIDIKDKSCVDVCPVDCIHEFGRMLVIDPEECIDCGACEPECPVEAIFPEDALPDKWEPFVKINYAFPEGASVIDALVDEYATEHNVQNEPLEYVGRAALRLPGGVRRPRPAACELLQLRRRRRHPNRDRGACLRRLARERPVQLRARSASAASTASRRSWPPSSTIRSSTPPPAGAIETVTCVGGPRRTAWSIASRTIW